MKKKLGIGILCVLAVVLVSAGGLAYEKHVKRDADDRYLETSEKGDVTREEWIEMLTGEYGITQNQKKTPYFSDVTEQDKNFSRIQAAVEWDILSTDQETFDGTDYASGRFVALTAMKVIGQNKVQMYLENEKEITDQQYISLAEEKKLLEKKQMHQGLTKKQCQQVLKKLRVLYFEEFQKKDYEKTAYEKGVVQLSSKEVAAFERDTAQLTVAADAENKISDGTIVVFKNPDTGIQTAGKLKYEGTANTYTLQEVKVEDVISSAQVSDVKEVTLQDLAVSNGWKKSDAAKEETAKNAVFASVVKKDLGGFTVQLKTEKEENKAGEEENFLAIEVYSNDGTVTYEVPKKWKMADDAAVDAKLNMEKIQVYGATNYKKKAHLDYAEVGMQINSSFDGSVAVSEEESISLAKAEAPLAKGLCSIILELKLVFSMDGSIHVKLELPAQCNVRYEHHRGVRLYHSNIQVKNPEIEANCNLVNQLQGEVILKVLDIPKKAKDIAADLKKNVEKHLSEDLKKKVDKIKIKYKGVNVIDAEAYAGFEGQASSVIHPNQQKCTDVSASYPTIEIAAANDEEANSLVRIALEKLPDVELKLTLISAEKAPYHFQLHYEVLPDQTTQYVKKCTYNENSLATYTTKYGEQEVIDCAEFTFDYPAERWSIDTEEYDTSPDLGLGAILRERVVLKSKHGATIEFRRFSTDDLGYGGAYWAWKYKISKVADSKFKPGYGIGTDHDYSKDLGKMVVAKCKLIGEMDGQVDEDFKKPSESNYYYAILPQSKLGTREDYDGTGAEDLFGYVSYFSFTSCTNEEFDKQDEKDILTIMDSFRESEEDFPYCSVP